MSDDNANTSRRLVHLPFNPTTGGFIGSVQSRLKDSSDPLLQKRSQKWTEVGLGELSLAITTKLEMLPVVERRIDTLLEWLVAELHSDDEAVRECAGSGSVFPLPHEGFLYELLVDLDCFLFESRSLYEILGKFAYRFVGYMLGCKTPQKGLEKELIHALERRGLDIRWIDNLREARKLFFHENAPWIAVDSENWDLVLMKKNVFRYDPNTCIDLETLREIHAGLRAALPAISEWLCARVAEVESQRLGPHPSDRATSPLS